MSSKINEIARCKDKICNIKKIEKSYEERKKSIQKSLKNIEKKIIIKEKKSENTTFLKGFFGEMKKTLKLMNKDSYKKKEIEKMKKVCENAYCNKGCKETLFQKGAPNKLPNNVVNKIKKNKITDKNKKALSSFLLETRKVMFGKKSDVLKNDFYSGLKNSNVKKMKKNGAISGCTLRLL